jgi:adenine-specific DNA-methyltransferase
MSTEPRQQELGLRETGPVKRVENYTFEPIPIRGYPILKWDGKRPFTSTQYYPAQHKETHGPEMDDWRNKIYWGDNLQVMSHLLKEYRGKVKLVYIDPPFDSKADYKRAISVKGKIASNDQNMFEEKQYTDIWTNDEYLQFIYERLILIRELLSDDGSLYLHCDWHKSHYLRIILDEVFGSGCFANEIVWHYQSGGRQENRFSRKHDTLFWYTKSTNNWLFNGESIGETRGDIKRNNMKREVDEDGRVYFSIKSAGKIYKYYEDEKIIPSDVWADISHIQQKDPQRVGYPTQKPAALLDRIIKVASNEGDIVFDCFMGSGTTQAVAMKLGRRFIGADINLGAVQIATKRLLSIGSELAAQPQKLIPEEGQPTTLYTGFEVYNVNNYDIFRNPVEAKDLLIKALEVNPLPGGSLFDGEKDGRMVKIMPINRIATRQDLNELITGFDYRALEKRQAEHPTQAVEKVTLVCMGHEPDLNAELKRQMLPYKLDVEVVDILRDKQDLQFKRDSEAKVIIREGYLVIEQFYPMNLLAKLSLQQENVEEWRELVDSVMIDWNYDGAILQPAVIDVPEGNNLVAGRYKVPDDAGTIRVKITDLLSESIEKEIAHG